MFFLFFHTDLTDLTDLFLGSLISLFKLIFTDFCSINAASTQKYLCENNLRLFGRLRPKSVKISLIMIISVIIICVICEICVTFIPYTQ